MPIKEILVTRKFESKLKSLDNAMLKKAMKQIEKIKENPELGKPLRYTLRGERSMHTGPYRLIYSVLGEKLILLRFMHRKSVYK